MNALLLVAMLSSTPVEWDISVWNGMSAESRLAWTSGVVVGLAIASYLYDDPSLRVRASLEDVTSALVLFYSMPQNAGVPMGSAFLQLSGKSRAIPRF